MRLWELKDRPLSAVGDAQGALAGKKARTSAVEMPGTASEARPAFERWLLDDTPGANRKDLAKRLNYAKLRVLFSDGELGIAESC